MTAETIIGAVGKSAEFRTCQYTGLKVDVAAQSLIKANAVAAVVFLLIGGLMGLSVALTRWPAVHLCRPNGSIWCSPGMAPTCSCSGSSSSKSRCFISLRRSCSMPARGAEIRLAWIRSHGGRRAAHQRRRAAGQFERDVHVLSADAGAARLLSRADPVRRRRADRAVDLLRHAGDRQGGEAPTRARSHWSPSARSPPRSSRCSRSPPAR